MVVGSVYHVLIHALLCLSVVSLEVTDLVGSNGFIANGEYTGDHAGHSVSFAGDVNNDGLMDIVVGAYGVDVNLENEGTSYVVFGDPTFWATQTTAFDLPSLTGAHGIFLKGRTGETQTGYAVSSAGDVNNDGFADVIVGAPFAKGQGASIATPAGESYLVFGKAATSGTQSQAFTILLGSFASGAGVTMYGTTANDQCGAAVSLAGDINADTYDDFLVGAPSANSLTGAVYLVFGASQLSVDLYPTDFTGSNGVIIKGIDANDQCGLSISTAGDLNGDGIFDIVIGAPQSAGSGNSKTQAGEVYVIFGQALTGTSGALELNSLDGTNGFYIYGKDSNDQLGYAVGGGGDINGDGYDDLILSAPGGDGPNNAGTATGEVYVVFGGLSLGASGSIDLSTLSGTKGFVIYGIDDNDQIGSSVSIAGDINGDSYDDIVIGASSGDGASNAKSDAGETYVVYGRPSLVERDTLLLSDLTAYDGFVVYGGAAGDQSGVSVSIANLNNDGFDDVLIGAEYADVVSTSAPTISQVGRSYVIWGQSSPTAAPTHAPTAMPTAVPTASPTSSPTAVPTAVPTSSPTAAPTAVPTSSPTATPTAVPTSSPTAAPTAAPTAVPTSSPTAAPTAVPTSSPTAAPTAVPTSSPTAAPTAAPTAVPTSSPTAAPTAVPTSSPTAAPTSVPTSSPTAAPTAVPTSSPTAAPTAVPTSSPTAAPTAVPTSSPTAAPTAAPTSSPTAAPTAVPTSSPTAAPTAAPTASPTSSPTAAPTAVPTSSPTAAPTAVPTSSPTAAPTAVPTSSPTAAPTAVPTFSPTAAPTAAPTSSPTAAPTAVPTSSPTVAPTAVPTSSPTAAPTAAPTRSPTPAPTAVPTSSPTAAPTAAPTAVPTSSPTVAPTAVPTAVPTLSPTAAPTAAPTAVPTSNPTVAPTAVPTSSPTAAPTAVPTSSPTSAPTAVPTLSPTAAPTAAPTAVPTSGPTVAPTAHPTTRPTVSPTFSPTTLPTKTPTTGPTFSPTRSPTTTPTIAHTSTPTARPTASPSHQPTIVTTAAPSSTTTSSPSSSPTLHPTFSPTSGPSGLSTHSPSNTLQTASPTTVSSSAPTEAPTVHPKRKKSVTNNTAVIAGVIGALVGTFAVGAWWARRVRVQRRAQDIKKPDVESQVKKPDEPAQFELPIISATPPNVAPL